MFGRSDGLARARLGVCILEARMQEGGGGASSFGDSRRVGGSSVGKNGRSYPGSVSLLCLNSEERVVEATL